MNLTVSPFRRRLLGLATLLAICALAAACAAPGGETPAAPTTPASDATAAPTQASDDDSDDADDGDDGDMDADAGPSGAITFAHTQLPPNGDPYSSVGTTSSFLFMTYSEPLMRLDEDLNLVGGVAESWEQVDETTYRFTLRPDLTFHNGESLDAEAIKFVIDRAIDPATELPLAVRFGSVAGAEVVDETTIDVMTENIDVLLPRRMIELFTIPPAYFEEVGPEEFGQNPIGSGPFEVTSFSDEEVVVTAVPDHFRAQPGVEQITFVQLPEEATRMAALQAGDVDIAYALNPQSSLELLESDDFQVQASPVSQYRSLMMRTPTGEPIDNVMVRQALALAIDKDAVADLATAGLGEGPASQLASPGVFGYIEDLEPYPYDPEQSRELLAEAGYPDGVAIDFNFRSQYSGDRETAEAIDAMLREVGVEPNLQELENAVFSQAFGGGTLAPLATMGIGTTPLLDADISYQWYRTDANSQFFSNPEFDEAFAASRTETDPAAREALLQQAMQIAYDEYAFVPLYTSINPVGLAADVSGFEIQLDGRALFENVRVEE